MRKIIVLHLLSCCIFSNGLGIPEIARADEFATSLLSKSLGADGRFKTLIQIQNAAYRMSCGPDEPTKRLRNKLIRRLKVAGDTGNKDTLYDLVGKILFVLQKIEKNNTLKSIIMKYNKLRTLSPSEIQEALKYDGFGRLYKHLLRIDGGSTLLFTVDTTGSMHDGIIKSKLIAKDIVNDPRFFNIDYILSPFNDPATGPVSYRSSSEGELLLNDLEDLPAYQGGDCPELSFRGMQDALDFGPQFGSSMIVFTDSPPKDGSAFNVQKLIDTASNDDTKISFFLSEEPCGLKQAIASYYKVAADTTGMVFRATGDLNSSTAGLASSFSPLVASSIRATSLLRWKPGGSVNPALIVDEYFYIDDGISFVTVIVVSSSGKPTTISLVDPDSRFYDGNSVGNANIFNIDDPVAGKWKLSYPETYSCAVNVAFKYPIAIDVRYFYADKYQSMIMVPRPLKDTEQDMMINIVGRDRLDLSSLDVSLVKSNGDLLAKLLYVAIELRYSLKLMVKFTPPNIGYRVRVTGFTKTGYEFERLTNQITRASAVVFKILKAADEFSARIGSTQNRIAIVCHVKKSGAPVRSKLKVSAKYGRVVLTSSSGSLSFQKVKILKFTYDAPTNKKHRGRCDHIMVKVHYGGEISTFRISILLL